MKFKKYKNVKAKEEQGDWAALQEKEGRLERTVALNLDCQVSWLEE